MIRLLRRLFVPLLLAVLAALPAATRAASLDAWAGDGIVQATGGPFLSDTFGRALQLHGAGLVAKCGGGARPRHVAGSPCIGPSAGPEPAYVLSPTASDPGRRFTAADAQTLASLGFTVVRLGIIWEGLEPGPRGLGANDSRICAPHRRGTRYPSLGRIDPYSAATVNAYLASTDRIVQLLGMAGIRVIVDMHQDAYGSDFSHASGRSPWNGEGAPAWATCTDGWRLGPREAYWGRAYYDRAVQHAIGHFWRNDVRGDLQGQFARVWEAVARHYRGNPEVIGYEVFNEPADYVAHDFASQLQCAYGGAIREPLSCRNSRVQPLRFGLIGAIQAADATHPVLYEPMITTHSVTPVGVGTREPLRFPDLALAFHIYGQPPPGVFGCPGTVCRDNERKEIDAFVRIRARTHTAQPGGPPMIMDEFGGSRAIPDIAQVVGFARQRSLSWSYWSALQAHDPTGDPYEGLLDQTTRRPPAAKARVLASPYPMATAGTPGPQTYDAATRTMTYRFTVNPQIAAPTEIVVPPYTYPHGYIATATGANATSASNAPVLTLAAQPGAPTVRVTVRPVGS